MKIISTRARRRSALVGLLTGDALDAPPDPWTVCAAGAAAARRQARTRQDPAYAGPLRRAGRCAGAQTAPPTLPATSTSSPERQNACSNAQTREPPTITLGAPDIPSADRGAAPFPGTAVVLAPERDCDTSSLGGQRHGAGAGRVGHVKLSPHVKASVDAASRPGKELIFGSPRVIVGEVRRSSVRVGA